MFLVISWLWNLFPVSRLAAAWWAWRNRREVARWLGFAWRAVPPSSVERADLVAEAKVRTALARDPRTRGAPSLTVRVHARTAFLAGGLPPDIHDLAYAIAQRTTGVLRVVCAIRDRGRRRTPETHPHHGVVAALPPPPPERHPARSIP